MNIFKTLSFIFCIGFSFLSTPQLSATSNKDLEKTLLKEAKGYDLTKARSAITRLKQMEGRKYLENIVRNQLSKITVKLKSAIKSIGATEKSHNLHKEWSILIRQEDADPKTLSTLNTQCQSYLKKYITLINIQEARQFFINTYNELKGNAKREADVKESELQSSVSAILGNDFALTSTTYHQILQINSENSEIALKAMQQSKATQLPLLRFLYIKTLEASLQENQRNLNKQLASSSMMSNDKVKPLQKKLENLRQQALENIKILRNNDETIKKALTYHTELGSVKQQLDASYDYSIGVMKTIVYVKEIATLWKEVGPLNQQQLIDPELTTKALTKIGYSFEQMKTALYNPDQAKDDPFLKHIWYHAYCQTVSQHNERYVPIMDSEEYQNVLLVNDYRMRLGLIPYEIDPRLNHSAREHSREMQQKNYFSHTSPVAKNKTFKQRIKNAGYKAGSSECIANGASTGERAFWMWFHDRGDHNIKCGHHRAMVGSHRQIGVGRSGRLMTQNYGRGPHLNSKSDSELKIIQAIPKN